MHPKQVQIRRCNFVVLRTAQTVSPKINHITAHLYTLFFSRSKFVAIINACAAAVDCFQSRVSVTDFGVCDVGVLFEYSSSNFRSTEISLRETIGEATAGGVAGSPIAVPPLQMEG